MSRDSYIQARAFLTPQNSTFTCTVPVSYKNALPAKLKLTSLTIRQTNAEYVAETRRLHKAYIKTVVDGREVDQNDIELEGNTFQEQGESTISVETNLQIETKVEYKDFKPIFIGSPEPQEEEEEEEREREEEREERERRSVVEDYEGGGGNDKSVEDNETAAAAVTVGEERTLDNSEPEKRMYLSDSVQIYYERDDDDDDAAGAGRKRAKRGIEDLDQSIFTIYEDDGGDRKEVEKMYKRQAAEMDTLYRLNVPHPSVTIMTGLVKSSLGFITKESVGMKTDFEKKTFENLINHTIQPVIDASYNLKIGNIFKNGGIKFHILPNKREFTIILGPFTILACNDKHFLNLLTGRKLEEDPKPVSIYNDVPYYGFKNIFKEKLIIKCEGDKLALLAPIGVVAQTRFASEGIREPITKFTKLKLMYGIQNYRYQHEMRGPEHVEMGMPYAERLLACEDYLNRVTAALRDILNIQEPDIFSISTNRHQELMVKCHGPAPIDMYGFVLFDKQSSIALNLKDEFMFLKYPGPAFLTKPFIQVNTTNPAELSIMSIDISQKIHDLMEELVEHTKRPIEPIRLNPVPRTLTLLMREGNKLDYVMGLGFCNIVARIEIDNDGNAHKIIPNNGCIISSFFHTWTFYLATQDRGIFYAVDNMHYSITMDFELSPL